MLTRTRLLALMSGAGGILAFAGQAHALGTAAGTTISNTATVGYSVGGVSQTPVNSNTATFLVDKRVNLTVAKVTATQVVPGSTSQAVAFTVTNTTNSTQDFRLLAAQETSGTTTGFSKTDSFDTGNTRVFVEGAGTTTPGIFNATYDTATYIDELAPDTSRTVFIVSDVPATAVNGGIAGVSLTAVAAAGGTPGALGSDLTQTTGADNPNAVDTVFADAAGPATGDALHDGKASDHSEYDVVTATIALVKSSKVISDPIDLTTNPKAIPLAVVEYCIQVQNTGNASASGISITDAIPVNTTYYPGSIYSGGTTTTPTGGTCNADGTAVTDASGYSSTGNSLSVPVSNVAAGATSTVRFRVTIN